MKMRFAKVPLVLISITTGYPVVENSVGAVTMIPLLNFSFQILKWHSDFTFIQYDIQLRI